MTPRPLPHRLTLTVVGIAAIALVASACDASTSPGARQTAAVSSLSTPLSSPSPMSALGTDGLEPIRTSTPDASPRETPLPTLPGATAPPTKQVLPTGVMVPVIDHVKTTDKVVFLTIDDGYIKEPDFAAYVIAQHIPLTMFLTNDAIKDNYAFFKELQAAGYPVEDHTMTHVQLTRESPSRVKSEICDAADRYTSIYGKRPTLFRPPYGSYNDTTRVKARQCGMKALVQWRASMPSSVLYLQGTELHAGDIILLHFHKNGVRDMKKLQAKLRAAGLAPALLTDYVQ